MPAPATAVQYEDCGRGTNDLGNILRKAFAMPLAALMVAGVGATTVTPAVAAPNDRGNKSSRNYAQRFPIQVKYVKKYNLSTDPRTKFKSPRS